jgi:hypothetical protein
MIQMARGVEGNPPLAKNHPLKTIPIRKAQSDSSGWGEQFSGVQKDPGRGRSMFQRIPQRDEIKVFRCANRKNLAGSYIQVQAGPRKFYRALVRLDTHTAPAKLLHGF